MHDNSAEKQKSSAEESVEQRNSKNASLTYAQVSHALASDYARICCVDPDTDRYTVYIPDHTRMCLTEEETGTDYFAHCRKNAWTTVYTEDLPMFLDTFTKANILDALNGHGAYTLTYRNLVDDIPVYMNLKIIGLGGEDRRLIVGVSNVDEQMQYQESMERMHEERATYARITALSGDYICIYTVDPETERYSRYSVMREYEKLSLPKEGEGFFSSIRKEAKRLVHPEDLGRVESIFTKENVLEEIRQNGIFALTYRLMLNGVPIYVMTKGAVIRERNEMRLIIGINNVDAQVRREQEYENNLSLAREKANVDALTGVRNKHAYNEAEAELNRRIAAEPELQFAVVALDVNNLKLVNDTKGHAAGDALLREACGIICRIFSHSPVFRVGGDEFTVISQGEDYENIDDLLAQLRESNERNALTGGAIVASGAARFEGDPDVQTVFERADAIMYREKKRLKASV